jgi:hypothetical protein
MKSNGWHARGALHCAGTFVICLMSTNAYARVESIPIPCGADRYCLWDRPVLQTPGGWELDDELSRTSRVSVYHPASAGDKEDRSFVVARAVRRSPGANLDQFAEGDLDLLLARQLNASLLSLELLGTRCSKPVKLAIVVTANPGGAADTAAFADDGEFFVVLVLSTSSAQEHAAHFPWFREWVVNFQCNRSYP